MWEGIKRHDKRLSRAGMLAVKIALGSSGAIYIAELLHLDFAISAGTIALLTLMVTKWETVRLSLARVATFGIAAVVGSVLFTHLHSEWLAFGIYILLMVAVSDLLGWRGTISVNAVTGAHFMQLEEFTLHAVWNEFQLVLIGIFFAIVLNLFNGNRRRMQGIANGMRDTELRLQSILVKLAAYLKEAVSGPRSKVWDELAALKKDVQELILDAHEYQDNTFQDMGYYYAYLEMRLEQCSVLENLHGEMRKIRKMPKQAQVIAEYMEYVAGFVVERNHPERQMERLQELFAGMEEEPLPESREEFESRAILYHVLMDLEDFLECKSQFVDSLTPEERKKYWS